MAEHSAWPLAQQTERYIDAWCSLLSRSTSDTRAQPNAAVVRALLFGLGRIFTPDFDTTALAAVEAASLQRRSRHASRSPFSGGALLAASTSVLTSTAHSDDRELTEAMSELQSSEKQLLDAAAAAAACDAAGDPAAALQAALHAGGRFPLLADCLLTGAMPADAVHAQREPLASTMPSN